MKIKIFVLAICIILITQLQSTVINYVKIYDVKPNLFIVFIVIVALLEGNVEGAIIGFFCGLSQDMAAGKVIGFYALLGLYLGLLVGSVNRRLYRENIFVIIFFTFISTVAYEWCVYFLSTFWQGPIELWYPIKSIILPEAAYNSAVSIFLSIFAIRLYDKFNDMDRVSRKY